MELNAFMKKHAPGTLLRKASATEAEEYLDRLPDCLLELWRESGFGAYGNGIIRVINPDDYADALATWLGRHDERRIPIAVSAFGDIFYYRDLDEGEEDVSRIMVHYKSIDVCVWSLKDFFNEYLCDHEIIETVLRDKLFRKAVQALGPLADDEMYGFVPALAIGGAEDIKFVKKQKTLVHLELLFQM